MKPFREAAVLIPLFRGDEDDLRLVIVRRGEGGVHGGQLAFPGGKCEPEDASPMATALREAHEEIGLDPERVSVVAHLPFIETHTTGFRIFPFLARVVPPPAWQRQEAEIAEVIEARIEDLARPEAHQSEVVSFPTWPRPKQIGRAHV